MSSPIADFGHHSPKVDRCCGFAIVPAKSSSREAPCPHDTGKREGWVGMGGEVGEAGRGRWVVLRGRWVRRDGGAG
jgi:hypothetical protein